MNKERKPKEMKVSKTRAKKQSPSKAKVSKKTTRGLKRVSPERPLESIRLKEFISLGNQD